MPDDYRDSLLRPPAPAPDWATLRARRAATARRLLAARLQARGVAYLGASLDEAAAQLYHEAGAPYGGEAGGMRLWLDDQATPEDAP